MTQPLTPQAAKEAADRLGLLKAPRVQAVPVLTGSAATDPEAWLAARDAGVGASEIGVITGDSTFSSRYALWWQKHLHWRLPQNEAMADGHALEDMVAAEFMLRHPELFVATPAVPLWRHPQYEWALCTPDRLAVQDNHIVPVEVKWDASPGWGPSGSDEVPAQYRLQVMWQAWIFGAPGGWLVNHKPSGRNRYREYWIAVDENEIRRAVTAGQAFMVSLECGVSPDPDGSKATERTLQELNANVLPGTAATIPPALAEAWMRARNDVRAAEAYKRQMDNRLREVLGDAERGIHADSGAVFVERRISKRAGYEVAPALVDSLRRVSDDGGAAAGTGVPAADGAGDADAPAGEAGVAEEVAGHTAGADASGGGDPGEREADRVGGGAEGAGAGASEGAVTDVTTG